MFRPTFPKGNSKTRSGGSPGERNRSTPMKGRWVLRYVQPDFSEGQFEAPLRAIARREKPIDSDEWQMDLTISSDHTLRSNQHQTVVEFAGIRLDEANRCVRVHLIADFRDRMGRSTIYAFSERLRFCQRPERIARERAFRKDNKLRITCGCGSDPLNDLLAVRLGLTERTIHLHTGNVCFSHLNLRE